MTRLKIHNFYSRVKNFLDYNTWVHISEKRYYNDVGFKGLNYLKKVLEINFYG